MGAKLLEDIEYYARIVSLGIECSDSDIAYHYAIEAARAGKRLVADYEEYGKYLASLGVISYKVSLPKAKE